MKTTIAKYDTPSTERHGEKFRFVSFTDEDGIEWEGFAYARGQHE